MLPMVMRLKIVEQGRKKVNLWFPAIIGWLFLFVLLIILFPLVLLAAILTWGRGPGRALLAFYPMIVSILFNLSDLHIEVEGGDQSYLISFR
jgi:hypothetical protein